MNTVFVLTIGLACVWWVVGLFVPSVVEWNAYDRVFFPTLPIQGTFLAIGALTCVTWEKYTPLLVPYTAGWHDRRANTHLCGLFVVAPLFLVAAGYELFFVSETTPGFSVWVPGVCGACSCTANSNDATLVFNPNGVFGGSTTLVSFALHQDTFCVYDECNWAGSNGIPIVTYPTISDVDLLPDLSKPPCAVGQTGCVASNRKQDWPDWGTGLVGFFLGFATPTTPELPCPGVVVDPNNNQNLIGQSPCAMCDPNPPAHCLPQLVPPSQVGLCFLCPWPDENKTPLAMQQQAKAFLYLAQLQINLFLSVELVGKPRLAHTLFALAEDLVVLLLFIFLR